MILLELQLDLNLTVRWLIASLIRIYKYVSDLDTSRLAI